MSRAVSESRLYSEQEMIAQYIEAEWGDFLDSEPAIQAVHTPITFGSRTLEFYTGIKQLLIAQSLNPKRIFDVGSATGRMVFEHLKTYPNAEMVVGCEPSPEMSELSRNIILQDKKINSLPIFSTIKESVTEVTINPELFQSRTKINSPIKPSLVNSTLENAPFERNYFDLITCLNVVDRHPHPKKLVELLFEFLSTDGFLCLASPLDWEENSTNPEEWVDNLQQLLPKHARFVKDINLTYSFRCYAREIVSYSSQVILVQKTS